MTLLQEHTVTWTYSGHLQILFVKDIYAGARQLVTAVKLRLENVQSGVSDKRGVLSSNAGITQNLKDVDFSDKELAQIGLQKGVLGLPELLGCVHSVLLSTTNKNNNSGDNKTNNNEQCDVMVVD